MSHKPLFSNRSVRGFTVIFIFCLAFVIRLYDLTDLPLDFHPTRQLLSAIKARAIYYQTQPDGISTDQLETGIRMAKFKAGVEPVVFERLVAFTYQLIGEQLWVARVYSSLFWLIGGVFLFLLARDLISFDGALISTVYYLFFPYAIIASRSFQPDPLMVMLTLVFWWSFFFWMRSPSWGLSLLAGLVGGFAIFIKFSAAFFVIGGALGLALSQYKFRDLLRNGQAWMMAVLGVTPAMAYLVYGIFFRGGLNQQFAGRFIPALLLSPLNYLAWETKVSFAVGGLFIMLALLALLSTEDRRYRSLLYGLWSSYLLYGLFFDYHVATHDYYHLPLLPIVGLSLAPLGNWFLSRVAESTGGWARGGVFVVLIFGLLTNVRSVAGLMKREDFRPQAVMWAEISREISDARVIALMEDYGARMEYWGLKSLATWPTVGDLNYVNLRGGGTDFDGLFRRYSSQRDLFLVTNFEELMRQPELRRRLELFSLHAKEDGYWLFDLNAPIEGGGVP